MATQTPLAAEGKLKMKRRSVAASCALLLILSAPAWPRAKTKNGRPSATAGKDQFFIIESVNLNKKQLVLKHPTEVTELMQVADSTVCVDEREARIPFKELRAGDTVYVVSTSQPGAPPVARRIRRAPMTVEELHRRYLSAPGGN